MKTRLLAFALLVLANNLAWVYLTRDARSSADLRRMAAMQPAPMTTGFECAGDGRRILTTLVATENRHEKPAPATGDYDAATSSPAPSPMDTGTDVTAIPTYLSQEVLLQRQMELEYFFHGDTAKKLQTIETLSPQGDALDLLARILKSEPDSSIKIAALNRLKQERNYAATALLIDALDDHAVEVSTTALDTLVAGGDRTLVPLLKERMASQPDEALRNRYLRAIHELEYSASMAMDGVEEPTFRR